MGESLPEMAGGWDEVFDESYVRASTAGLGEGRTRAEAEGAARLAGVAPGAEVLDCPCGFARHALVLSQAGYRVTGVDRSEAQLAEAERRRGASEWPRLVRADYRQLPFPDASFDAVLCLHTSLGLLDRAGDIRVLAELRRVLRAGRALIVETMHRDHLARIFRPRDWRRSPDGTLRIMERAFDLVAGTVSTRHDDIPVQGERTSREVVYHVYTATEWAAMLREGGFHDVECFADWDGAPASPEARLVVRAR